jgi:predicted membrane-bound spermidine synthase
VARVSPPLGLVVFVVGASSLGSEIAAARLLAPYFGDSTIIWANTIGIVLVALSIGYWIGGRVADIHATPGGLHRLVLVAAALLAVVPFLAGPFLGFAVDALDSVEAGAFTGSLLGVLVLVAVPVLVLGMVSPYAIRLALRDIGDAGKTAGRLYAISTLGSLAGTFLSALLLIPLVGTRRTFLVYALALAVIGVLGVARARFAVVPVAIIVALALPVGLVKADSDAGRVVDEADTEYQYARVVESPGGERRLELNEGQAIHSLIRPGTYLTDGYWDDLIALPSAARGGRAPGKVAILGNAGGTVARALGHFWPGTIIDGVEIDGEVSELGRRWFDMQAPGLRIHTEDARPFLRRTDERYDSILVDAYRQPYIPFYLCTREFFELAAERLAPGGRVIINVGHPEDSDRLEKVLTATMRETFASVVRVPSESVNTILVAGDASLTPTSLGPAVDRLPAELRERGRLDAEVAAPGLRGGTVYTDDKAPVEWLVDASLLQVASEGDER